MTKKSDVIDLSGHRLEGKRQLLEQLFSEHGAALRGFLRGLIGSSFELEDVVQDLFVKLAKQDDLISKLPSDREKWRAYLVTMASNLVVDLSRYHKVRKKYLDRKWEDQQSEPLVDNASPEKIALSRQELERVKTVILELPPRWRQAFILSRFKYKSYPQIAEEMGVSAKQIEKYMRQALVQVRAAALEINEEQGK